MSACESRCRRRAAGLLGLKRLAVILSKLAEHIIEGNTSPTPTLKTFPETLELRTQQIRLYGVVHVRKIPRLFAISKNKRLRIFQECRAELGQHSRIRRTWILPRPKYIEISQRTFSSP